MKRILPFLGMMFLLVEFGSAQTGTAFAPFVSRLQVRAAESSVTVTWKDSKDVTGSYLIYRFTREIKGDNFSQARLLGTVAQGKQVYIDFPLTTDTYYYAVLAREQNGKVHELFIPFRNISIQGVSISKVEREEAIIASVTGIKASIQEDSILITFQASRRDRDLIIYRSTQPIRKKNDLVYSQALRAFVSAEGSFKDFPVPGISYYYAIVDSSLVKSGDVSFAAGQNSTITPVEIPLGIRVGLPQTSVSRPLPLPLYPISVSVSSGERLVQANIPSQTLQQDLSPGTGKTVVALLSSIPSLSKEEMKPVILAPDRSYGKVGSDQYTLKSILDKQFAERRWDNTELHLNNYLSVHREREVEVRSHFYLGQVLYFLGNYRPAFMEFLLARDTYYTETLPWMNAIFNRLDS